MSERLFLQIELSRFPRFAVPYSQQISSVRCSFCQRFSIEGRAGKRMATKVLCRSRARQDVVTNSQNQRHKTKKEGIMKARYLLSLFFVFRQRRCLCKRGHGGLRTVDRSPG